VPLDRSRRPTVVGEGEKLTRSQQFLLPGVPRHPGATLETGRRPALPLPTRLSPPRTLPQFGSSKRRRLVRFQLKG